MKKSLRLQLKYMRKVVLSLQFVMARQGLLVLN
jgi:ssDNA-specific exonuclease RecJ